MKGQRKEAWHIGVIGGTGLYDGLPLDDAQEIAVASPFGEPSGPVTTGRIGGIRFTFLARHGEGHRIPADEVNYRANIDVMKRCGVTDLVAIFAIGSLREEMAPGHFVAADQIIDRTAGRERSFFGTGMVAHVALADPVCARLSGLLADAAEGAKATVHRGGCYVAVNGPQFSTRAESRMYREWGADVIGMTAMPEARLAREAELPYAMLAMVTDYDSWRDDVAGVDAAEIFKTLKTTTATAHKAIIGLAKALPKARKTVPADTALDNALVTPPPQRDPRLVAMLDSVAGRVLG
ncbi:S-methyl-5'-thioadenosine phosphorylase [Tsuneonella mangrovi]|uniref:S-methyl-5'-thioadenosine phosphorylase n=1 Tax=Tsuneonella mangrovi TaxID=1982042 RepID=UPI000BA1D6C0|nr:S-methyl-5'-thioadenosine phosphorylase [Tsuneonella mangrovi]